jgi:hypothetical protein
VLSLCPVCVVLVSSTWPLMLSPFTTAATPGDESVIARRQPTIREAGRVSVRFIHHLEQNGGPPTRVFRPEKLLGAIEDGLDHRLPGAVQRADQNAKDHAARRGRDLNRIADLRFAILGNEGPRPFSSPGGVIAHRAVNP